MRQIVTAITQFVVMFSFISITLGGNCGPGRFFAERAHQMNRKLILAAVVASAFTATNAFAATAFDDFTVKIVLTNSCTIVADDLDFGSQTGLTANIDV